jgi:hypothetical protein
MAPAILTLCCSQGYPEWLAKFAQEEPEPDHGLTGRETWMVRRVTTPLDEPIKHSWVELQAGRLPQGPDFRRFVCGVIR